MTKKKKAAKKQPSKTDSRRKQPIKEAAAAARKASSQKQQAPDEHRQAMKPGPVETSASQAVSSPLQRKGQEPASTRPSPKAPRKPPPTEGVGSAGESRKTNGTEGSPIGAIPDTVAKAAEPLQTFAIEMQRMAKQSIEQTSDVLERLRDAKSVEEVVSLQTTFMQQSFRRYTEFAGRISQLMTASQASLFRQGQAAMRSFRSIASGA